MQVTREMVIYFGDCAGGVVASLQALFDKYVTPLENDCKRFESAYLELRDKLPVPCAMPPDAVRRTVAFEHNEKHNATLKAKLHVWYMPETAEVLRVDVIPRDLIREEAHNLAALHSLQGIPVDAIERVLREVRK